MTNDLKNKLYAFIKLMVIRKNRGLRIPHIISNLQLCFLPFLNCFAKQVTPVFEQTAEKCIIFASSTNESAQEASQEASITTKGGHNRRQAPVIY